MRVSRRSNVLGRRARRRLDGLRAALAAAIVEVSTVGTWFALIVFETRTAYTALAGIGVLLFGALVRTGVTGSAVGRTPLVSLWRRLLAATLFAASWPWWLLVAESVDGRTGVFVAGAVLAALLSTQFALEHRAVRLPPAPSPSAVIRTSGVRGVVFPAVVLAVGATTLLALTWFTTGVVYAVGIPVGEQTLYVEASSLVVGLLVFGLCSLLAHDRRITRLLDG